MSFGAFTTWSGRYISGHNLKHLETTITDMMNKLKTLKLSSNTKFMLLYKLTNRAGFFSQTPRGSR